MELQGHALLASQEEAKQSEMWHHPKACRRHMPGPGWALCKIYSYSGSKPESGLSGVSSRPTGSRILPSSFKCLSEAPSISVFFLNKAKNGSICL